MSVDDLVRIDAGERVGVDLGSLGKNTVFDVCLTGGREVTPASNDVVRLSTNDLGDLRGGSIALIRDALSPDGSFRPVLLVLDGRQSVGPRPFSPGDVHDFDPARLGALRSTHRLGDSWARRFDAVLGQVMMTLCGSTLLLLSALGMIEWPAMLVGLLLLGGAFLDRRHGPTRTPAGLAIHDEGIAATYAGGGAEMRWDSMDVKVSRREGLRMPWQSEVSRLEVEAGSFRLTLVDGQVSRWPGVLAAFQEHFEL